MNMQRILAELGRLYLENRELRDAVDELNAQAERWFAEQAASEPGEGVAAAPDSAGASAPPSEANGPRKEAP